MQEIYSAYKERDDEEFNTYITQPFLTSAESDKLLEKLRDQHFFDKFAYNAQVCVVLLMCKTFSAFYCISCRSHL